MTDYYVHIYFFGLICHMGEGASKHFAAIVRDEDHTPYVLFDEDRAKWTPIDRDKTDDIHFEIGLPERTTGAVTEADARASADILRFVPSLQRLMGGSPRIKMKDYAIQVYYPESYREATKLSVAAVYDKKGWYLRFGTQLWGPDCVARLTGIDVRLQSIDYVLRIVRTTRDGLKEYIGDPLKPGSCIVIANLPNDPRMVRGHVMKYGHILTGAETIVTVVQQPGCGATPENPPACPWVSDWLQGPAPTDVECGNTGWP